MSKIRTSGRKVVEPSEHKLKVLSGEYVTDYGPQLKLELMIAEGKHKGFTFFDYPTLAEDGTVKIGSKAGEIFEACLKTRLTADDELDIEDLVGKRFIARVVVKQGGKGNRTEFGTIRSVPRN